MTAKWTILMGEFSAPPLGPPILDQDGPCGLQILSNTPSWVKGKQINLLVQSESQIIMFRQKRSFWVTFGGVFCPPGPPILDQGGPWGLQILSNTPSWVKGKQIDLLVQSKRQISCLGKNGYFESNLGVFSAPPGPPILDQDGPCGI